MCRFLFCEITSRLGAGKERQMGKGFDIVKIYMINRGDIRKPSIIPLIVEM